MSAADLQAILGVDEGTASALLEAAGGDLELAINLGMDGGGLSSGGSAGGTTQVTASGATPTTSAAYPHWNLLWPEAGPVPASWSKQRLDAFDSSGALIQNSNGPCGVLSVVQLELWEREVDLLFASPAVKAATAVEAILERILATKVTDDAKAVGPDGVEGTAQEVSKRVQTAQELVEAAVLTKGVEELRAEMVQGSAGGVVQPLVDGPFWLCGADLMSLLLRGTAGGNYSAYESTGDDSGKKRPFYGDSTVAKKKNKSGGFGILSWMELEEGIPIADDLKFPELHCNRKAAANQQEKSQKVPPMWIVHGGDHFTVARQLPFKSDADKDILIEHFNGLPPGGPRHSTVVVKDGRAAGKILAPDQHVETFKKRKPGQADDIVQAKKTISKDYKEWSFEVVPAVDDPDVQGPVNDDSEPTLTLLPRTPAQSWRCAWCYSTRFKTMCFGINEPLEDGSLAENCIHCGKKATEVGYSTWLSFADLPPSMKKRAKRMYAPKFEQILGTVWKGCEITTDGENPVV